MNAVDEMQELYGHLTSIEKPVLDDDGQIIIQHNVYRGGRVDGKSKSLRFAQELGAKKIIRFMLHRRDVDERLQNEGYQIEY